MAPPNQGKPREAPSEPNPRRTDPARVRRRGPIELVSKAFPRPAPVMLVRVEPADEPPELGLIAGVAHILRVRHPLPACERIATVRPAVVIVGREVNPDGLARVSRAARLVGAEVLALGTPVNRVALREWLERALERHKARSGAR